MEKLRRQKIMAISTAFIACLFFGVLLNVYQERQESAALVDAAVKRLVQEEKHDAYAAEIDELNRLAAGRFISENDRIRAYSALATIYIWQMDYLNAVKYSVKSICCAERIGRQMSAAWSYLQLSDVFLQLGAYDMAEELVRQALAYQIEIPEEDRRVKELAYVNMADLCAATNRNDEARRYLQMADAVENKEDLNHQHLAQSKWIIRAETFWNEKNFSAMREMLRMVDDTDKGTDMHMLYVHIPLLELKSKLAFIEGDLQSGEELSSCVLAFYTKHNDNMKKIEYLTELSKLMQTKNPALAEKYNDSLALLYPQAMREANGLAAQFLLSTHQESVSHYYEQEERSFWGFVAAGCFLTLSLTLYMLRRIWRQSRTDALTGVYNRRYLNQMYGRYKKKSNSFGVIMFDIDYFKQVNDTWGHKAGDTVLKELSGMCLANLPERAKLFRFGGEEFCILYRTEEKENVVKLAHDLRRKAEAMEWEEAGLRITISLGVAYTGQDEELLILADKHLYQSKLNGRNMVTYC